MAISLKKLIENPSLLDSLKGKAKVCSECHKPMCALTGINKSSKGLVCDDCYYSLIGDEIEKCPICSKRSKK